MIDDHYCVYGITNELRNWLVENTPDHHTIPIETIDDYNGVVWLYFDNDFDSIAFKLRWL